MNFKDHIIDLGVKFTASDIPGLIGPTPCFEDGSIIRAHDGYYYLFFDDNNCLTGINQDVYCVRSNTPTFDSFQVIGKVIDTASWGSNDVRVGPVIYNEATEEYVLILSWYSMDVLSNCGLIAFCTHKNNFPYGPWERVSQYGLVLVPGGSGAWDRFMITGMTNFFETNYGHTIFYSGQATLSYQWVTGMAYTTNPKGGFTKYANNPLFIQNIGDMVQIRAVLPLASGYLIFYEGYPKDVGYPWDIGAVFLDNSLGLVHEVPGSPLFKEGNRSFANADSVLVEGNKAYLYFSSTNPGLYNRFVNMHVAEIDLAAIRDYGVLTGGRINHLSYWHSGMDPEADWPILDPLNPLQLDIGASLYLCPWWLNTGLQPFRGHIDTEITLPDGSKQTLLGVQYQDRVANPGEGYGVGLEPITLSQLGDYIANITLSEIPEADYDDFRIVSAVAVFDHNAVPSGTPVYSVSLSLKNFGTSPGVHTIGLMQYVYSVSGGWHWIGPILYPDCTRIALDPGKSWTGDIMFKGSWDLCYKQTFFVGASGGLFVIRIIRDADWDDYIGEIAIPSS